MSHEMVGPDRKVVYRMPALLSDVLRSREFSDFFESYHGAAFSIQTKDGWSWSSSTFREPVFTVTFKTRGNLDDVVSNSMENALMKMFFNGDLDFEGDNSTLFALTEYILDQSSQLSHGMIYTLAHATREIFKRLKPTRNGRELQGWRSATCLSDLPIDLLRQWLGPSLDQSCAFFRTPAESFETAQRNGLERVCNLLDLQDRDRLLDVCCGWGSLILYAAANRRLTVQGITSTTQQADVTTEFIRRSGLERQCSVEYRDIIASPYPPEAFDKITDINVLQPAASSQILKYFDSMHRILAPGGLLLLQRMTLSPEGQLNKNGAHPPGMLFTPDAALLSTELQAAETSGFEVHSVKNLSEDYRQTLRLWIEQLQYDPRLGMTGVQHRSYRTWLLYLVETAANLEAGDMQFHQILLRRMTKPRIRKTWSRPAERGLPSDACCSESISPDHRSPDRRSPDRRRWKPSLRFVQ